MGKGEDSRVFVPKNTWADIDSEKYEKAKFKVEIHEPAGFTIRQVFERGLILYIDSPIDRIEEKKKLTHTRISVDKGILTMAQNKAVEEGRSLSEVIRKIIDDYLDGKLDREDYVEGRLKWNE